MIEKMDNKMPKAPKAPKVPELTPVSSKTPQAAPPVKAPVVKMPITPVKEKKSGANLFMAVLISVVIILLLSAASWFLVRKYIWQPQQSHVENQFKTVSLKLEEFDTGLENEKDSIQELLVSIDDLKMEIEGLKQIEEDTREIKMGSVWQNYKNDDWGIEFSYPADWEVYEKEFDGNSYLVVTTKDTQNLLDNKEIFPGYPYNIEIHHYNNFTEFSLAKNVKGESFLDFPLMNKSGVVEFIEESGVMENSFTYLENGHSSIYCLVTEHNGDIYDFRMGRGGDSLGKDEMMILNLLKFTK